MSHIHTYINLHKAINQKNLFVKYTDTPYTNKILNDNQIEILNEIKILSNENRFTIYIHLP